jgi:sterol desaturase/sphingolipid hydroxylase (fatty acid hydroxylase superfamily)
MRAGPSNTLQWDDPLPRGPAMIPFEQLPAVWLLVFAIDTVRYALGAGLVVLALDVAARRWAARYRIQTRQASAADRRREIGFSLLTTAVYACVGLLVVSLQGAGHLRIYTDASGGMAVYTALSLPLLLVLHDTWFYWVHRLMHHPRLFRHFHRVHHLSRTPTPWAAYAFAPGEALLMTLFVPLVTLVLPVHEMVLFVFLALMIVRNAMGHSGIEFHPAWWIDSPLDHLTSVTHHDLHHQRFNGNYGLYFTWWDRWMGTEFPDYRTAFRAAARGHADG